MLPLGLWVRLDYDLENGTTALMGGSAWIGGHNTYLPSLPFFLGPGCRVGRLPALAGENRGTRGCVADDANHATHPASREWGPIEGLPEGMASGRGAPDLPVVLSPILPYPPA